MANDVLHSESTRISPGDRERLHGLGTYLRDRRLALGLTQTQLAERLGWLQERISLLENAKYGMPSLPAMERLAAALDVSMLHLLGAAGYDILPGDLQGHGSALLLTLQRLARIRAFDLRGALTQVADVLIEAMGAQKADAFMLEPDGVTLYALGVSETPLGRLQEELGLDRLTIAHGGTVSTVFASGEPYLNGDVRHDARELQGVREQLHIDSAVEVPLSINGRVRGVLAVFSQEAHRFDRADLVFLESVALWVGILAGKAELEESIRALAREASDVLDPLLAAAGENDAPHAERARALLQRLQGQIGNSGVPSAAE